MIKIKRSELESLSGYELAALVKKYQEYDRAQKSRSLESYIETAHPKQIEFHKADKRIRFFLGGNRSGKTTGGAVEMNWWMLGRHPYRECRLPMKGLLVAQDFENHVKNILEPKFEQWTPAGAVVKIDRNQQGAARKIYYSTGSTLDIMSHDQDVKVFEGSDYDVAWFDEPPPKHIFTAVWRGLTDRGGFCYVTGTPIVGPWMYQEFKLAQAGDPLRWCIFVPSKDNATNLGQGDRELGLKRLDDFAALLPEEEKAARLEGEFLQLHGIIFKNWDPLRHKIHPFPWPYHWPIIESIDPHPAKPWAVSWIGITENNKQILVRSGYYEGVLETIADQIVYERSQIPMRASGLKPQIKRTLIDNSSSVPLWNRGQVEGPQARRVSVREELERYIGPLGGGPKVEVAPKNVQGKIEIFRNWLNFRDDGMADFYAFDNAENEGFFNEIDNYVWDSKRGVKNGLKDQPRKIGDDILDSIMQTALTLPKNFAEPARPLRATRGNSWKV